LPCAETPVCVNVLLSGRNAEKWLFIHTVWVKTISFITISFQTMALFLVLMSLFCFLVIVTQEYNFVAVVD
jgi:hypothetical protein